MIDSHTHLDSLEDPDAAVASARSAGVHGMISIGCGGAERIRATLAIAHRNEAAVRVAVGIHPQEAQHFAAENWPEIEELARDPLVVAVGETGFDQYRDHGPLEAQLPAFELQAALARELDLPLVIHSRAADEFTLDALARHAEGVRVVLHCFSLATHVNEVIRRGYWCSFAGNVTYRNAADLREAAARVPEDRLLVETDAPYLAPIPKRGRPNEPAFVAHTLAVVAQTRGITVEAADAATSANAVALFGLPGEWAA